MKYQGFIKRSRTYDLAALLVFLGALQVALPQLLGPFDLRPEWVGSASALLGIIVAVLRTDTTGPVGQKGEIDQPQSGEQ